MQRRTTTKTITRAIFAFFPGGRYPAVPSVLVRIGTVGLLVCLAGCGSVAQLVERHRWGMGDHAPAVLQTERERVRAGAADPAREPAPVSSGQSGDLSTTAPRPAPAGNASAELPSTATVAVENASTESLAEALFQIVDATERNNPALRKLDLEMKQLQSEMDDILVSNGWEFEIVSAQTEMTADRFERRDGWTRQLDGDLRSRYQLFGEVDENESEFILRLQRSFGAPDHENHVEAALQRLEIMDKIVAKQEIRREVHLATIVSALTAIHAKAALPLYDRKIEGQRRIVELLEAARKLREALEQDVLDARRLLHAAEEQRKFEAYRYDLAVHRLLRKSGLESIALPSTFPVVADTEPLPAGIEADAATSHALQQRLDYHIAQLRLELAERLSKFMAWYLPTLDFEVFWNRFHGHRTWLDEFRSDRKGREFGTEITFNLPLNLPRRGWARHRMFQAMQDTFRAELEEIELAADEDVFEVFIAWKQAQLARELAAGNLEFAREEQRSVELTIQQLPETIKGLPQVRRLEAEIRIVDARLALLLAERDLLIAQIQWDYLRGRSPVDQAVAPYENRELRTAKKKNWVKWLASFIM